MKLFFTTIWLSIYFISNVQAQFGVQSNLVLATFNAEPEMVDPPLFRNEGFQLGAHYFFRLKNIRLEFFPEISYTYFNHAKPSDALQKAFKLSQWGLAFPIAVYPLDLLSDCNCPTFSKQNETFKKGLFLQIIPGYFRSNYQPENGADNSVRTNYPGIGGAIGLDIGLSDLFTITPLISYIHYLVDKNHLEAVWIENELHIGFRLGLRPDYRNPF